MTTPSDGKAPKDLLGREMTAAEQALLDVYHRTMALLEQNLSPTEVANVKEAAAALWQAANNLALTDERPPL